MLCVSLGNIFSDESEATQSREAFRCAILLWSKFFSWVCVTINQSVPLLKYHFTSSPDNRPRFFLCWRKMVGGTFVSFLISSLILVAIEVGIEKSETAWKYNFDLYLCSLCCHADTVSCTVSGKRIYREQTVEGGLKWQNKRQPTRTVQFVRTFFEDTANIFFCIVAALYARGAMFITLATQLDVILFTLGSFALKLCMQEFARHIVFKKQILHVGVMAAMVGVPTILIDTQMRVAMMRSQSAGMSLIGAFAMTFVEIMLRLFKAHLTIVQLRNCSATSYREKASGRLCGKSLANLLHAVKKRKKSFFGVSIRANIGESSTTAIDRWRAQALLYHAAEVYIDMFAEYVALGCSYAILFLCWNHPKYKRTGTTSALLATVPQIHLLAVQFGLEIVVDYVSCLLETRHGIDLKPLHRHGLFLAVFLVWAAVGNLLISGSLFIQD
uniref:Uncharacterized protein n=1 Tax=Globisporangium ultimum (strain ATCC 200006 / CBS 805.95 / DAOM BR144) TaxID=431595 RepID=K3WDT4_GLOUD